MTVVTAIVAVLGVMALPGVGIGPPATSHAGSPSDAFTSTEPEV